MKVKIHQIVKQINELESQQEEIPACVWRLFIGQRPKQLFSIAGGELAFSYSDGDYASIEVWQEAIEYLVKQFGGIVFWDPKELNKLIDNRIEEQCTDSCCTGEYAND